MTSDGPKNSQGYVRILTDAGMTGRPYWHQLLDYTGGLYTREVANAELSDIAIEDLVEIFAGRVVKEAEFYNALERKFRWLSRVSSQEWDEIGWKIAKALDPYFRR